MSKARGVVSYVQSRENEEVVLGGPGIDVEIDEVCFRARWAREGGRDDGEWGREWIRYIAAVQRGRSEVIVLKKLPSRWARGAGQGGGGSLTSEELHSFIFRLGKPPLLRPGTVVHTDGAAAYRDLGWNEPDQTLPQASARDVDELVGTSGMAAWRLESFSEVVQREAAERRESQKRSEHWSSKYRHLRLSHTSVSHSKQKSGPVQREFVAVRRVRLHPETVAEMAAAGNTDPWMLGGVTWRKSGTQIVDGYWK